MTKPPVLQGSCKSLQYLYYINNKITDLTNGYFEGCQAVQYIYLTNNLLTKVPYIQPMASALNILDVAGNEITGIISENIWYNMSVAENIP